MTVPVATFAYTAAHADGRMERGILHAATDAEARSSLIARQLYPLTITPVVEPHRRTAPSVRDSALALRALGTLLEAGLPLARALSSISDVVPRSWIAPVERISQDVRQGSTLAGAIANAGASVPPPVIALIQAGEAVGDAAGGVSRAAQLLEHTADRQAALRAALSYPMVLALTSALAIALLVGIVLPKFEALLLDLGQTLPPITRTVLVGGKLAREAALPGVAVAIIGFLSWRALPARDERRRRWHGRLLATPIIGPLRQSLAVGRACSTMEALLRNGIPLPAGLLHGARASGDSLIESRLLATRELVLSGSTLADALARTHAFTPMSVRLIRAGEDAGRLPDMLGHAGSFETRMTEARLRVVVRLVEPLLLLLFGGVIAVIAIALLQAVYTLQPA